MSSMHVEHFCAACGAPLLTLAASTRRGLAHYCEDHAPSAPEPAEPTARSLKAAAKKFAEGPGSSARVAVILRPGARPIARAAGELEHLAPVLGSIAHLLAAAGLTDRVGPPRAPSLAVTEAMLALSGSEAAIQQHIDDAKEQCHLARPRRLAPPPPARAPLRASARNASPSPPQLAPSPTPTGAAATTGATITPAAAPTATTVAARAAPLTPAEIAARTGRLVDRVVGRLILPALDANLSVVRPFANLLRNPNIFCFINSIVQALCATRALHTSLSDHAASCTWAVDHKGELGEVVCYACALFRTFASLLLESNPTARLHAILSPPLIEHLFGALRFDRRQQDANELLTELIDVLPASVRNYFMFAESRVMECLTVGCGFTNVGARDPALLVNAAVSGSVMGALQAHFAPELFDAENQWACPKCAAAGRTVTSTRSRLRVFMPPQILIVSAKRFELQGGETVRLRYNVSPERDLFLNDFCDLTAEQLDAGRGAVPSAGFDATAVPPLQYSLSAVVCHNGEAGGGHYTTAAKCFVMQERSMLRGLYLPLARDVAPKDAPAEYVMLSDGNIPQCMSFSSFRLPAIAKDAYVFVYEPVHPAMIAAMRDATPPDRVPKFPADTVLKVSEATESEAGGAAKRARSS